MNEQLHIGAVTKRGGSQSAEDDGEAAAAANPAAMAAFDQVVMQFMQMANTDQPTAMHWLTMAGGDLAMAIQGYQQALMAQGGMLPM